MILKREKLVTWKAMQGRFLISAQNPKNLNPSDFVYIWQAPHQVRGGGLAQQFDLIDKRAKRNERGNRADPRQPAVDPSL